MKRFVMIGALAAFVAVGAYAGGLLPGGKAQSSVEPREAASAGHAAPLPAVSVAAVTPAAFVDSVLVTGSLVARHEILVAPEVEGLRIVELAVEEGERVGKAQVLARLEQETLDAQLAQNSAALARSSAAMAQARSQIAQAEARLDESRAAFERAQPLRKSGAVSDAVYDQREAAARTAQAMLVSARDGLKLAEAERDQIQALRRELDWKRSRTEVRAPDAGLVSRRTARVGGVASAVGEPMFRMAAAAEIELEAEVPEADIARLAVGQTARIQVAGLGPVEGRVRLVPPEVDRVTRLGKVRIFLGSGPGLRIGAFGRGKVQVAASSGLSIPLSAVTFNGDTATALVVEGQQVRQRLIKVGLVAGDLAEVTHGLGEGELVVAKAGTFLRDGDLVRPVRSGSEKVSGVN